MASRAIVAFLLLAAVALVGCGRSPDHTRQSIFHEVVPVGKPYVELKLFGMAVNQQPQAYESDAEEVPVADLVPEGSFVRPGDFLVKYEVRALEMAKATRDLSIREEESRLKLERLQADQEIELLESKREDLVQQQRVLEIAEQATRQKDVSKLRIAALEVKRGRMALAEALQRLERLQGFETGIVNRRELRKAQAGAALAEQALRLPEAELEFLQTYTGSTLRRLIQINRDAVSVELGDKAHEEGVFKEIAAVQHKQQLQAVVAQKDLGESYRRNERDTRLLKDSSLRAKTDGVVRYHRRGLKVGDRSSGDSIMFVLRSEHMGFTFDLPVRYRNLVQAADPANQQSVRVDVPQLGLRSLPGHVRSVSATSYPTAYGRAHRCEVTLNEPLPQLCEGMLVDCRVQVPVAADALQVPIWAITDVRRPHVSTADGSRRPIEGLLVGKTFVVVEGLKAGERIRARPDVEDPDVVRLTGRVYARQTIQLRVMGRKMEIVDMVPEGTYVNKGDLFATLTYASYDQTRQADWAGWELNGREKAAAELAVARIEGETEVAKSYVMWRKAVLAAERARLESLIERYASFGQQEVAADVQLHGAEVALHAAEEDLALLMAPAAARTVSEQMIRDGRGKRDDAVIARDLAQLEAVASMRQRDWIAVWQKQADSHLAEEDAEGLRNDYSIQRENMHLMVARAIDQFQVRMDRVHDIREWFDNMKLRAPRSGRVYYNSNSWSGREIRQLKTGERLRTDQPFYIPTDDRRELRLEVPARFHGRFDRNQKIPVHLPVLGGDPVVGSVEKISHHFHPSELAHTDLATRATVGPPPMVFTVTIGLALSKTQADLVGPGVTGWVEFER